MVGGAEVQRVRLTCARGEMSAGSAARLDDSKPMVGEMDSSAAGQAEVVGGGGVRVVEAVTLSPFSGDLVDVDQPCFGVNVKRFPRASDMVRQRRGGVAAEERTELKCVVSALLRVSRMSCTSVGGEE